MNGWRVMLISAMVALPAAWSDGSPEACAPCHSAETARFATAAMTRALESAGNCAILRANPKLAVTLGNYAYEIVRVSTNSSVGTSGDQSIYTVTDGKETIRVPVEWAFGQGAAGQTYVFQRDGKWYESRVSYFAALRGLDLTIGHAVSAHSLEEAVGRVTAVSEMRLCFDCHATNIAKTGPLSLKGVGEGVKCERCHGPTEAHLTAGGQMKKLGRLTTEEQLDFCGQCHRTWSQVALKGPRGIQNVRFQPYRLANSRCYDAADRRIRCTACHDPHGDVETVTTAYDAKCTACHSRAAARRCKVAQANCVTCHMPRLELPGSHQKFTDHRIRIVRANESYPD
jgi:hypothetical protein